MKARISEKLTYGRSGITLSVGMIVKNEEKYLEKCLSALKPLLDAIPSELIITDTGSTDKTVEIAEKFTKNVLHFDWINDFAAARNLGLKKAQGEWFMFIDADEIFEQDLSEMLDFFCDRQALDHYKSATYMISNVDADGTETSRFRLSRIVKRAASTVFLSPIHEYLDPFQAPTKHLGTITKHWGYAHDTEEEKQQKKQRNLIPLFEFLKKNPNDLRTRVHIMSDLEGEKLDEFTQESLTPARKQPNHPYSPCVYAMAVRHSFLTENHEKVFERVDEFMKLYKNKQKTVIELDILAAKALSLLNLERQDEAIAAFDEYFKLYEAFIGGRLDDLGRALMILTYCEADKHAELKAVYNNLLLKTGRKTFTFSDASAMKVEIASRADTGGDIPAPPPDESDESQWLPILEALKNNADITEVLEKTDSALLGKYLEKIAQLPRLGFAGLVLKYNEEFLADNLGFAAVLYEAAAGQAGRLPWHERGMLYRNLAKYISLHMNSIYKPEFLTEANLGTLPEVHRYGYYVSEALQKLDGGDTEGYVAALEKAKGSFTSDTLIWAVEFLIEDVQE
jgi:glycosyltransferase involved in cell wall biosynthesis